MSTPIEDLPLTQPFAMTVWMYNIERRIEALEAEQKRLLARIEALERATAEKQSEGE